MCVVYKARKECVLDGAVVGGYFFHHMCNSHTGYNIFLLMPSTHILSGTPATIIHLSI